MIYATYAAIGIAYWIVNIFVRKLHTKNEPEEGWILTPLWLFAWPICFIALIVSFIYDYTTNKL